MATSSIFANFEMKDRSAVQVFVDALCSDKPWPQPNVAVRETQRTDMTISGSFSNAVRMQRRLNPWYNIGINETNVHSRYGCV